MFRHPEVFNFNDVVLYACATVVIKGVNLLIFAFLVMTTFTLCLMFGHLWSIRHSTVLETWSELPAFLKERKRGKFNGCAGTNVHIS